MARFQPVLPLFKTSSTRRRTRTWQILGLVILIFLALTFVAVRCLPATVLDPVSVLKSRDFQDIFVPPIPRPPTNWPNQDHNHSLHLLDDQSRLKNKIYQNPGGLINLDNPDMKENSHENIGKASLTNGSSHRNVLPVENLTQIFSHMSIEELQKIQSVDMRREKVREVSHFCFFFSCKNALISFFEIVKH